jgi:glycosyltransferase involved in cell wall biosynthesis
MAPILAKTDPSARSDNFPPDRSVPVSVVVPVKNESANIRECLAHLAWANEVFVVDSASTDGTCDIAISLGAKVFQFKWDGGYPKKKNWAIDNLPFSNGWILIVDADEHITPELAGEIANAVSSPGDRVGFYINRKFIFLGAWIRHCGYYPSWNLRLLKRGSGHYERLSDSGDTRSGDNEVHEHVICKGPTGSLKHDMLHYAFPSIDVFIEKHNRYSNWEALVQHENLGGGLPRKLFGHELERRRFLKSLASRLHFRPALRFLYSYIFRAGFLDGRRGLVFCRLLATYEFLCVAKLRELRWKQGGREGR